ncbi:MAG TPA: aminoglycoside phosphotransferase [Streptosporangiaceae bacterium]|nr:aminoglycoside phosphotransferase [Streptosporangiaceae bacterium]
MSNGPLADLLADWLPSQRWFAGGGATIDDLVISSDVRLAEGDPELRHLVVDVTVSGETSSYQVLTGLTSELAPELARGRIGTLADGRTAYDGALDPQLTSVLLRGIADQRQAGPIRFAAEDGAGIDVDAVGRTLPALQSNTGVVFGNRAILKLLRRPSLGGHPDLEIPATLAREGSQLIAAPLGWMELRRADDHDSTVLAILSTFYPNSTDGWSLATARLHAADPDFTSDAELLGEATARLHAELAAAFGTDTMAQADVDRLTGQLAADLARAIEIVPELADYKSAIGDCYMDLAASTDRLQIQRIHGDYHLGQVLRVEAGWVILDFEGEPLVPLAQRRAFAPALRDVAGMLRSFDYAARHQLLADPGNEQLASVARDWVGRCQDAFCTGYGAASGTDPRASGPLLRALTLSKAVYEAVYETRHRPGWLPIPLQAIDAAVAGAQADRGGAR